MSRQYFDPSNFNRFAVEGARTPGAKGVPPDAGQEEPDPEWQAL